MRRKPHKLFLKWGRGMRVIRTEMYFDKTDLRLPSTRPRNPGVAVAWFKTNDEEVVPEIDQSLIFRHLERYPREDGVLRRFIDISIQGQHRWIGGSVEGRELQNPHYVQFVLSADIVLERSPPTSEKLNQLFHGGSAITIGTAIGMGLSGGSYPLMLVTVPGGIILMGAAIGVSKGLQNGLNKKIEKAISGSKTRRR